MTLERIRPTRLPGGLGVDKQVLRLDVAVADLQEVKVPPARDYRGPCRDTDAFGNGLENRRLAKSTEQIFRAH